MPTRRLHQIGQGANENGRGGTSDDRLWVVDLGGGQLRVVQGHEAVIELIESHDLPSSARAYELSAVPKTLGEITEVALAFGTKAHAPVLETPAPALPTAKVEVAAPAAPLAIAPGAPAAPATAAPHNGSHDAEFSLLDRPFDDTDYFEEPLRARWPRIAGVSAIVVLLAGGGYKLVLFRSGTGAPVAATVPESTVIAAAPPLAPAPPPAMPAPSAAPVPVAAPAPIRPEQRLPDPPLPPAPTAAPSPSYSALVVEGQHLFNRGHGRKAQALFEQALADQPDGIDALVGLAYAQLDRGKMLEAIASFKQALDQDGSHARAVFGLAESYRQQGNRSAALGTFKRYLKLQPSGADADIARRLVQDLNAGL
jgi:hypothetical protein